MAIQSIIFHRIERFAEDQPAKLILREASCESTADHEALFSQLKKIFQFKAGKLFGQFDLEQSDRAFEAWIGEYLNGKIPFDRLSLLYADKLKEYVDKTSESFANYLCCIHEDRADGQRLYLFLLETSSGMLIDSNLQLDTVEHLNSSRLDLAVRIELENWNDRQEDSEPLMVLVKSRTAGKLGEAFAQSLCFKSNIDTAKETETLIDVLAHYTKESDPKEGAALRQKAYDFCVEQQQQGEAVPLSELSGYLDENEPTRFTQFASEHAELDEAQTLHPDTRKLKHLVRLSGKGNGLSLSFSSDLMQQTILFDEKQETLTITAIPKSLKKQIMEHLQEAQSREQEQKKL